MEKNHNFNLKLQDDELVQRLYIATPCDVPWDSMVGDECKRFCGQCSLNVYNVASLSTKEAASLIRESEGRVCLRLYRRLDGTIITDNCPVGLRKLRDRMKKVACSVAVMLAWFGLMSSAQAQGLVGAPVDPRYGVAGQISAIPQEPAQQHHILEIATFASCLILVAANFLKRGRIALLGTLLLGIWSVAGIAMGICYR